MRFLFYVSLLCFSFYLINCNPTSFSSLGFVCEDVDSVDGVSCEDLQPVDNEFSDAGRLIKTKTRLDKIDILFVMDNSGSMREEQQSMANQFDSFLEDIIKFDYQIAIITTDWANPQTGGGQFLKFPNQKTILSNPKNKRTVHRNNISLFQQTISPPYTSTADDEKGLHAVNMALNINEQDDFFRPHSLFIIIFVSDEDNSASVFTEGHAHYDYYDEDYDDPKTLFKRISRKHKFSAVVFHSIISDPDSPCGGQMTGKLYSETSHPSRLTMKKYGNILKGEIGSICATNYGSQLGNIADYTVKNRLLPLSCYPLENSVSLYVNGKKEDFILKGRKLLIKEEIPFNSEAEISYRCPTR